MNEVVGVLYFNLLGFLHSATDHFTLNSDGFPDLKADGVSTRPIVERFEMPIDLIWGVRIPSLSYHFFSDLTPCRLRSV